MTDEQQIRDLIERWAAGVHDGDMPTVLADHAPDIVMFDVPPPQRGVRGLDAYRDTWPGFFEWQASGAVFEIESLDITAGADVAFAFALLRCGTPADFDRDPEHRLRLTIGLHKLDDQWVVTHEHHSFVDATGSPDVSAAEVRAVHEQWFDRTAAKDLDGLMEHIAPDIVSYEHAGPLQYVGIDDVREVCRHGLNSSPGRIAFDIPDLSIHVYGDRWAYASLRGSPGARSYYDAHRARGQTHNQALRALANRLVGILHGCLAHRQPYREDLAWRSTQQLPA